MISGKGYRNGDHRRLKRQAHVARERLYLVYLLYNKQKNIKFMLKSRLFIMYLKSIYYVL